MGGRRPRDSDHQRDPVTARRLFHRRARERTQRDGVSNDAFLDGKLQGYLKLPNGRAMTGQSHDYKRHGTMTLFAALEVATGKVVGRHYRRRRRIEFLDIMNRVVAAYPDRELHVILDNLSTHKPRRDQWLARHRNVHFHYTPTHGSWLNQIEVWFSILAGRSLKGASFASRSELIAHIAMPMLVGPLPWLIFRTFVGFGCAGLFVTTESWLNAKADPLERGRVFSIYMVGTFLALAAGQLLIGWTDIEAFTPFNAIAILFGTH